MPLAGDTQNVDISWCEHAGGAGELLQLRLVLHAVICSFAGRRAASTSSLNSGTRTAAICSSLRLFAKTLRHYTQRDLAHAPQSRDLGCDALRECELVPTFASTLFLVSHVTTSPAISDDPVHRR